jgi:hypothetical protein
VNFLDLALRTGTVIDHHALAEPQPDNVLLAPNLIVQCQRCRHRAQQQQTAEQGACNNFHGQGHAPVFPIAQGRDAVKGTSPAQLPHGMV